MTFWSHESLYNQAWFGSSFDFPRGITTGSKHLSFLLYVLSNALCALYFVEFQSTYCLYFQIGLDFFN